MKKTIIASSLAVGLGVVAGNAGHADASEAQVNKAELAQLAQSNDQSLNNSPIQEGAYNVTFDYEGFTYHFESDGTNWSWNYAQTGLVSPQQDVSEQASAATNQTSAEQVASSQQSSQAQPTQVQQAPQTQQTQQPQTEATTSNSSASSGSSVNVNSHLQQIAQRESGGDITAINPSSGAAGKYQFLQSTWDSVAPAQYKGVSPAQAPEHVQDAAAVKLYNTAGPSQWVTA
ncbi:MULTISPECIES: transglycosylase family protein [unclassified Staphylococcus]|uniref:transglycosylase family protein n=1 Tax=unclassified Staphylococcus TaxID=91994 RepID=UPI0018805FB9|nr:MULTISPECIES: transglycosylase family protein [unclassified Staphylococcus]MBF2757850.1 transglycosylase family protein [Staphylococcus haemolyticus]MBF2772468.1 transglycosylase family protein [Staphylococcus haemolyticus]MBF2776275.1 transglycosylase family protein [Staphylococcus haemolyticus]MBF2816529.1 transglycosylase family protein [Staphylococcus haemolyticus]MBF9721458.1 transglycosylase family protein [Staphylococcus haemolyticus]